MSRFFAAALLAGFVLTGACKPTESSSSVEPESGRGGSTASGGRTGSGGSGGSNDGSGGSGGPAGSGGSVSTGSGGSTSTGSGGSSASGPAVGSGGNGGSGGSTASGGAGGASKDASAGPDTPTAPEAGFSGKGDAFGPEGDHLPGRPDLRLCRKEWTAAQCCEYLCGCLTNICSDSPKGKPGIANCMSWCPKLSDMARRCHVYHCFVSISPTGGIKDHDSHCGHAADQVAGGGCPAEAYK